MKDAELIQQYMEQMLSWLEHEVEAHEAIQARIAALPTPLDYRMAALLDEAKEALLRIAKLEHILAQMALAVPKLERRLTESLNQARQGTEPASERKAKIRSGDGERQQ